MGHGPQVAVTAPLVARQTGIKTIAAVHSQCRSWVISGQTVAANNPPLSAVVRKRTKCCGAENVRYVPFATDAPQQIASLFDHHVGAREERRRHGKAESLGGL